MKNSPLKGGFLLLLKFKRTFCAIMVLWYNALGNGVGE